MNLELSEEDLLFTKYAKFNDFRLQCFINKLEKIKEFDVKEDKKGKFYP